MINAFFNLNITAYLQLIPQPLDANIQIKTDKTSSFARKTFFSHKRCT
jgi:hypothetical protein